MKLGTRMLAGSSRTIPGHFTPANLSITGSDSMTMSDTAAISGSGTAKIVTDSMTMTDSVTAKSLSVADTISMDDTASVVTPTIITPTGDTVLPGVTPPKLPHVSHVFSSPGGTDTPDVDQWFAEETAPGGYGAAGGIVEATRVHDQPGVYTPGANWQMWTEDGFLLWEGQLSNAIMHDGYAELVGRGWSSLAEKDAGRLLFMTHPEMTPGDSDPVNINISDGFEMDTSGSRMSVVARKGQDFNAGEKTGAFFWAEGAELTSFAYELTWNGFGSAGQSIYVKTGIGPSPLYSELVQELNPSFGLTTVDSRLNAKRDGDLLWLEVKRDTSTTSVNDTVKITLAKITVRGIANSDEYSFADVAREVCSRLGVSDAGIRDTGDVMGALDWTDGSFAELLDYGATLSATRWLFRSYGQGPVCEVDTWDADRFYTSRADGQTDLVPVAQYNQVVVAYPTHNGRHRTEIVTANDIGMADPYATTGYVNAFHVEIDQKQADADLAQSIGVKLLTLLIRKRMSGTLFRTFVEDANGHLVPAYRQKAGSTCYVQDGLPGESIPVRISKKRSTAEGVTFELDERVAEADAFLEKRKRRISVR